MTARRTPPEPPPEPPADPVVDDPPRPPDPPATPPAPPEPSLGEQLQQLGERFDQGLSNLGQAIGRLSSPPPAPPAPPAPQDPPHDRRPESFRDRVRRGWFGH